MMAPAVTLSPLWTGRFVIVPARGAVTLEIEPSGARTVAISWPSATLVPMSTERPLTTPLTSDRTIASLSGRTSPRPTRFAVVTLSVDELGWAVPSPPSSAYPPATTASRMAAASASEGPRRKWRLRTGAIGVRACRDGIVDAVGELISPVPYAPTGRASRRAGR